MMMSRDKDVRHFERRVADRGFTVNLPLLLHGYVGCKGRSPAAVLLLEGFADRVAKPQALGAGIVDGYAVNRTELQEIALMRSREAAALLEAGEFAGAYYLVGYAVECGLKACIAKRTRRYDFPDRKLIQDSYTHDLEKLLVAAELKREHEKTAKQNTEFALNWAVVKDWSEGSRYRTTISEAEARDIVGAVTARKHGILAWLKKRW